MYLSRAWLVKLTVVLFVWTGRVAADEPVLVKCLTTRGPMRIQVHPDWAPIGAERFLDLVRSDFFQDVGLTRVVKGFLVQFGIAADPKVQHDWNRKGNLQDDPNLHMPVKRGYMAYAGSGVNSRSTQIWIAFEDSKSLGTQPWETPFGYVVEEDMPVVDAFYSGYGDMSAFGGHGPDQGKQQQLGNGYLKPNFPDLDYIKSCTVEEPADDAALVLGPHEDKAVGTVSAMNQIANDPSSFREVNEDVGDASASITKKIKPYDSSLLLISATAFNPVVLGGTAALVALLLGLVFSRCLPLLMPWVCQNLT